MSLVSIAFVDRNDELLFAKEFASRSYGSIDFEQKEEGQHSSTSAFQCSLRHQFLLQSGLENMNQMIEKGSDTWREPGAQGTDAMFVGLLSLEDEFRLYGYFTTSKLKILSVVEDTILPDNKTLQRSKDINLKALFISHYDRISFVLTVKNLILSFYCFFHFGIHE